MRPNRILPASLAALALLLVSCLHSQPRAATTDPVRFHVDPTRGDDRSSGRSPQHALPVLAAYLGHCEYKHTTKYLKLLDASHRHNLVAFIQTHAHRP
jgi:hypothetical protein